ncbi:hypothetical protein HDU84_009432 [Entophlyctis sp. JEL0112]|nr:hypothetical protein HDU84_009432 [Entophlyctis sp. JEL0112]
MNKKTTTAHVLQQSFEERKLNRENFKRKYVSDFASNWQDAAIGASIKAEMKKSCVQQSLTDVDLAKSELLVLRRRDMCKLFQQDMKTYKNELELRGLSFHEDRI